MATDYTQRLDEETKKANGQQGNGVGGGVSLAARGGISAAISSPATAQAGLNQDQRSAAAFAYSQGVDRATGTGPATAPAAGRGIDMGIMSKRFDAYQKDPNALAMANARENMLGSGISMTHGPAGGLTITSNGIGKDALPAAGGSGINMNEANSVLARANATRQSMIDSAAPRSGGGSVGVIDSPSAAAGRDDSMIRDLYDATKKGTRSERANATLLLNNLLNQRNAAAMGKERMGHETDLAQMKMGHEGSLAQQRFALEQGAQAARQGIDMARLGMDQRAHEGQMEDAGFARLARQGLIDTANSKDPVAVNNARMKAIAAGILKPDTPRNEYSTAVTTDPMGKGVLAITRTNKENGAVDLIDPATGTVKSFGAGGAAGGKNVDPMAAAQAAIAKGADKAAVNARLRQMGYEEIK